MFSCPKRERDAQNRLLVSVLVPTKNSAHTLDTCLESIVNQTYKNLEIIVVDNFSDDETRIIAKKFGAKVFLKGPERSTQVNFGFHFSHGNFIYRVDSDFYVEPTVIEECVSKCVNEGYDGIVIHNTSLDSLSFWARVRKFERDTYRNDKLNVAVTFMRRKIFESLNGFDEDLVAAEDYDLHNRFIMAGYSLGNITAQEIHLGEPTSLAEVVRKHFYYGGTIGRFLTKNKKSILQLSPIRFAYLRHLRVFITRPRLAIGLVIYQTVRYLAAVLGFMTMRLKENK